MVIFGGIHELTQELNDLEAFDFKNKKWYSVIEENSSPTHSTGFIYGGFSPDRKSIGKSITGTSPYISKNPSSRKIKTRAEGINHQFTISIQKTLSRNRSRQVNQTAMTYGNPLTLSQLEKKVKQKRKAQERINEDTLLTSPTSLSMKNSFLIKTAGKAFDKYAQQSNLLISIFI